MNYLFKNTKMIIKSIINIIIIHIIYLFYSLLNKPIIIYNYCGTILKINNKSAKMLGYNKHELIGDSFIKLMPKNKVPRNLSHFVRIISEESIRKGFVERYRLTKDNTEILFNIKIIRFKILKFYISLSKPIQPSEKERQH